MAIMSVTIQPETENHRVKYLSPLYGHWAYWVENTLDINEELHIKGSLDSANCF